MNEEYLRTDRWFYEGSMLDICKLNKFKDCLFTRGIFFKCNSNVLLGVTVSLCLF